MTSVPDRLVGLAAVVFGAGHDVDGTAHTASIGATTARTLARHGASVAVVDRDPTAAGRTVAQVEADGGRAIAITADVTDPESVEQAVQTTLAEFGRLDIVDNNVGIVTLGGVEDLTLDQWRAAMATNLDGVFITLRATLPHLVDRGGSVVTISSTASIRWTGYPYPAYSAAKAAVNQLTQSVALQYADRGVRANAVVVGLVDTPMVYRQLGAGQDPAAFAASRAARSPTAAMGTAQDVANAVLFLASDESRYINGSLLLVDGGLHARVL